MLDPQKMQMFFIHDVIDRVKVGVFGKCGKRKARSGKRKARSGKREAYCCHHIEHG
jgi:hypothetical protein